MLLAQSQAISHFLTFNLFQTVLTIYSLNYLYRCNIQYRCAHKKNDDNNIIRLSDKTYLIILLCQHRILYYDLNNKTLVIIIIITD